MVRLVTSGRLIFVTGYQLGMGSLAAMAGTRVRRQWGGTLAVLLSFCGYTSTIDAAASWGTGQQFSADYRAGSRQIHYEVVPAKTALRVIFLHGGPGTWRDWRGALQDPELYQRATLIAVDRPGFGDSAEGGVDPNLFSQARILAPLLRMTFDPDTAQLQDPSAPRAGALQSLAAYAGQAHDRVILVGAAMGGPVAGELALDFGAQVQALVLVSPTVETAEGTPHWYDGLAAFWPIAKIEALIMGPSYERAQRETTEMREQIAAAQQRWPTLNIPVVMVQAGPEGPVATVIANGTDASGAAKDAGAGAEASRQVETVNSAVLHLLQKFADEPSSPR